jgi:hypothetical protein
MKLKTRALGALMGMIAFSLLTQTAVAADRPYKEGPVTIVTSIRTEPGKSEDYMAWLAGPWKQACEAEKAAGVLVSYAVYATTPRSPREPDLYLLKTYKNMAAFDDMDAKLDPIYEKIMGNQSQQSQATIDRGKIRTVLGDEMIRELVLK